MTIGKGKFKGRSAHRSGTSSDAGLVSNKMLKWLSRNCADLLTKVRATIDLRQSVDSGLKPLPTHSRSGRRIDNWRRLGQRLQDPEWRRYGYLLLFSKFMAILVLAFVAIPIVVHFVGSPVLAADPVIKANDIVNPINTLWTLLSVFLVFGMQAGILAIPSMVS